VFSNSRSKLEAHGCLRGLQLIFHVNHRKNQQGQGNNNEMPAIIQK